jgi:sugar phosphate permease
LQQQADTLKCGALATPVGFDWDGDGDIDILSGNTAGYIEFFENLSGPGVERPRWAAPKRLEVDGQPFRIMAGPNGSIQGPAEAKWGYTALSVADWDGDGLPDIVFNSIWGRVQWLRNIGTRTAPKLAPPQPVEVAWQGPAPKPAWTWWTPQGNELVTQWRTTPVAIDWTGNGLADLVMLDHEGYLALYERVERDGKLVLLPPQRVFYGTNFSVANTNQGIVNAAPGLLRLNDGKAGRSGRRKLWIADWDGDGKLDILVNSANANLLRQVEARDGKWYFEDRGPIVQQSIQGHTTSPTTVDFNGDGIPDFLGGAEDGRFYYYSNRWWEEGPPRPPTSHARHVVLVWLCTAAMIAYICRQGLAVAESTIRVDTGITEEQMGMVMSAFFAAYAILQIPSGWFVDRVGTRRSLLLLSITWSAATALMAWAAGLPMLLLSRFATGAAQAGLFPACTASISCWFPTGERGITSGALASAMSLGGVLASGPIGYLLDFGIGGRPIFWQDLFIAFGGMGILWGIGFYWWFRDVPEAHSWVSEDELARIREGKVLADVATPEGATRPTTPWLAILSSPAMWCICGQQFFRAAGYIFFASWFPTYLQETRGVSVAGSGLLGSLPLLAVVVGGLAGGALSDGIYRRTQSIRLARQSLASGALILCSILIFSAYLIADPVLASLTISAGMLVYAVGGPTSYSITIDMGGQHVGTVFSTMNMAGNIGATIMPVVVPLVKNYVGNWDVILLLFGASFFAAAICWMLLRPVGTIFDQAFLGRPDISPRQP